MQNVLVDTFVKLRVDFVSVSIVKLEHIFVLHNRGFPEILVSTS